MKHIFNLILLLYACLSAANPGHARRTCVVNPSGSEHVDDAPAIVKAFKDCSRHGRVIFLPTKYYVNSVMEIKGLEDVKIDIHGELLVRTTPSRALNHRQLIQGS